MGSYCSLNVGHLSISSDKGEFNPYLMALFQDDEKVANPHTQEEWTKATEMDDEDVDIDQFEFKYKSSLGAMRDRLSVVGISDETVRLAFEAARLDKLKTLDLDEPSAIVREINDRERAVLLDWDFDQWCEDVRLIHRNELKVQARSEDFDADVPTRVRYMLEVISK